MMADAGKPPPTQKRPSRGLAPFAPDAVTPEVAEMLAGLVGQAIADAATYASKSLSENTRRAYETDWRLFSEWCQAHDLPPRPAAPVIVAGYLATLAKTLGRSGLRRRLAAIAHEHRCTGHPFETSHPAIRATLRGILASHGKPTRPAAALTSAEVKRLLAVCGPGPSGGTDLAGRRDAALFLTGFAGALRRSELVAIDVEHLRFTRDGMTLRIPRAKGDQEAEGATIGIPRGLHPDTCPVRAIEVWLTRSRIEYGPIFRRLSTGGAIEGRLTAKGVWTILRKRADQAGLTVHESERLSPHGLRAGCITEAYLRGALDEQVMHHARQKSFATTQGYRRRAKITRDSPARLLDL